MAVIMMRTAGRTVLRRPYLPTRQQPLSKRHHTNSSTPTTAPPKQDDPANNISIPVPNTVGAIPLWQRLGPLSRAFQAYGRSQRKRPLATQFVSSLVIFSLGDISAQSIGGDEYDYKRTLRALVISAGSSIPNYKWFMFLNSHFNYTSKALSLVTKVTVNQIVFAPSFNTFFFGMQSFLSGDSLPAVWERIKHTVPTSVVNSCKLWPAVTAFSFTFIDPQYRSIFAGVIAIGWQTYLSFLNRKAERAAAGKIDGTFSVEQRIEMSA
ncbi:hypothetical protein ONS95_001142 [Cadophora gregata]|uniref:uncharacterized protein n=1 Tax=Cadophora gregata TaxID=51156 RepID=UPI0026DB1989|nr:uncharacterized protein ONS95_001142 [Cadophora gregata]KAK0102058.1 hypothetical protein ONS96_006022 [Cadophora gregata f. sp. sojae]KAK0129207.1 hypothetical protein ONS95_001142 [Cadophora gregata]